MKSVGGNTRECFRKRDGGEGSAALERMTPDAANSARVTAFDDKHRDQPQHITQSFDSGELPISAVTTDPDGPDDEGKQGRRPKADRSE